MINEQEGYERLSQMNVNSHIELIHDRMEIKEYENFEEKDHFFQTGSCKVMKPSDFDFIIEKLIDFKNLGFVFRGTKQAKYKLYTSGQRKYIDEKKFMQFPNYQDFILSEVNEFKDSNKEMLDNFLLEHNISASNHMAVLSLMQHHSYPSPCIDFTTDPLKALFFALNDCTAPIGNNSIDDFVSLYMIRRSDMVVFFSDFSIPMLEALAARNVYKGEKHSGDLNNEIPFQTFFLLDSPVIIDITNQIIDFKTKKNERIKAQEGLLLFNSSPILPLEEISKLILGKCAGNDWVGIKCINISKCLRTHILEFLDRNNVTKQMLYC